MLAALFCPSHGVDWDGSGSVSSATTGTMSNTGYTERRSWRQPKQSVGNRWVGRFLFTVIALLLAGWFVYILFDAPPQRQLRAFLVQAESYDTDVVMPPMFGDSARAAIVDTLESIGSPLTQEIQRKAADIGAALSSGLADSLADVDDTTMVIVRGYLLVGDDGQASVACSDLSLQPDSSKLTGLLPIREILDPLANVGPSNFEGGRLMVLDIEPFGALPRLDQYGDEALAILEQQVRELSTPFANRLWVLVTRGPLQSPGWDPASKMPISTQTFLDGLSGAANSDHDDKRSAWMNWLSSWPTGIRDWMSTARPRSC